MIQEEKQLLIKALCGRLPYGLKFQSYHSECGIEGKGTFDFEIGDDATLSKLKDLCESGNNKPYLRPMSSMTEEEKKDLKREHLKDEKLYAECLTNAANGDSSMRGKVIPHFAADWCNKNHFDYRIDPSTGKTLIESGLAIKAPEDMYKTE